MNHSQRATARPSYAYHSTRITPTLLTWHGTVGHEDSCVTPVSYSCVVSSLNVIKPWSLTWHGTVSHEDPCVTPVAYTFAVRLVDIIKPSSLTWHGTVSHEDSCVTPVVNASTTRLVNVIKFVLVFEEVQQTWPLHPEGDVAEEGVLSVVANSINGVRQEPQDLGRQLYIITALS